MAKLKKKSVPEPRIETQRTNATAPGTTPGATRPIQQEGLDNAPIDERFLSELCQEFPRFRIVPKSGHCLSQAIDVALRVITLGGQRSYLTQYHTVIGSTLYVPLSWAKLPVVDRVILLRHERVHLRQRRRYTFLGLALLYFLPFFPLGLAYGRARIEWEAYRETLHATAELKGSRAAHAPELRSHIIQRFVGPDYGWMWPFRRHIERWYDAALAEINLPVQPAERS